MRSRRKRRMRLGRRRLREVEQVISVDQQEEEQRGIRLQASSCGSFSVFLPTPVAAGAETTVLS